MAHCFDEITPFEFEVHNLDVNYATNFAKMENCVHINIAKG